MKIGRYVHHSLILALGAAHEAVLPRGALVTIEPGRTRAKIRPLGD